MQRAVPRMIRKIRRDFLVDWSKRFEVLDLRPKYNPENVPIKVMVISLTRTSERKRATVQSLIKQGVQHAVSAAVDGSKELNRSEVLRYAGTRKQSRMGFMRSVPATRIQKHREHADYESQTRSIRVAMHERLRFGCYMSHVRLWNNMLVDDTPLLVILEDDVELGSSFLPHLKIALLQLPDSWGVLYLGGCLRKFGPKFGERLYLSRGGLCTHSYVISKLGAAALLNGPALLSDEPVDHMMDRAVLGGILVAFHVEPPLVTVVPQTSTLAYI